MPLNFADFVVEMAGRSGRWGSGAAWDLGPSETGLGPSGSGKQVGQEPSVVTAKEPSTPNPVA